ncbi:MAG: cytochrome c [Burkholderiaceae bacterium]|nr:cytochrome c [Burkholderiaceae bacterium]
MRRGVFLGVALAATLLAMPAARADDALTPEAGRKAYTGFCARCHGLNLVVSGGGAFDLRRFPADDKARFLHSVNKGLRAMPAWEGIAKPVQIEAIWRYIGSVNGWPPEAMAGAENTAGSSQAQ